MFAWWPFGDNEAEIEELERQLALQERINMELREEIARLKRGIESANAILDGIQGK